MGLSRGWSGATLGGVSVHIRQIFISPGHNYFGHHGQPAGSAPAIEVESIRCVAGRGIEGDRFFDYKEDYKGQITFFAWEDLLALRHHFSLAALSASALRRNVFVSGLELAPLEGRRFMMQGVEFEGSGESKPCYWMDQAVAPGAEEWLRGRGGMRARITCGGLLRTGPADFVFSSASAESVVPV